MSWIFQCEESQRSTGRCLPENDYLILWRKAVALAQEVSKAYSLKQKSLDLTISLDVH